MTEQTPLVGAARGPGGKSAIPSRGVEYQKQQQVRQVVLAGYHTEEEIANEQRREAAQIAENVTDVKSVFQELNANLNEQQRGLTQAEGNVDDASKHVVKGREQLVEADKSASTARKRMCCLLLILVVVIAVVVIVVVVMHH